jgi:riboflavin kinase/FMN adenylyltransferase
MQSGKSVNEDVRLKTQDSRHKTQDTRHKTQDTRHKTQDTRTAEDSAGRESCVLSHESTYGVVLTFGVFDGVHIAHRIVISRVVARARALNTEGVVISFDPHPAVSISGEAPPALTSMGKKIELLEMLGIDRVVVEDFSKRFSQLSPEEFVRDILVGKFEAREVVVGYDCAFGKDRAGDRWLLKKLGEKCGFVVDVVEPYKLNGQVVSSTRIRAAILQADLEQARNLLGRYYSVSGLVVPGKGIGHKIGYATANLQVQKQVLPPPGVYAVKVSINGEQFYGMLNMGTQPTFGENEFRIEVHLLDFEGTLYRKDVEVFFVSKIRDEKAFASSKELAEQIEKDEVIAMKILNASGI